jgi:uncharacterized protein YndB with AHSA1/START domain
MGFLVRALKILLLLLLFSIVALWFAARRGDRGYIQEVVTIDRPAGAVFRWITTDELLRRWISDIIKLEKIGPAGVTQPNTIYQLDESIGGRRVAVEVKVIRVIPNQEVELALRPAAGSDGSFAGIADFKLFPDDDYTRVKFTSQMNFQGFSDQMMEPILTYATRKKIEQDLTRLKLSMEAEPATRSEIRR